MEHVSYEERLRQLGLFREGKALERPYCGLSIYKERQRETFY